MVAMLILLQNDLYKHEPGTIDNNQYIYQEMKQFFEMHSKWFQ